MQNKCKKPLSSRNLNLHPERIQLILNLRYEHNLGTRCVQAELIRLHNYPTSFASIHKVLTTQ